MGQTASSHKVCLNSEPKLSYIDSLIPSNMTLTGLVSTVIMANYYKFSQLKTTEICYFVVWRSEVGHGPTGLKSTAEFLLEAEEDNQSLPFLVSRGCCMLCLLVCPFTFSALTPLSPSYKDHVITLGPAIIQEDLPSQIPLIESILQCPFWQVKQCIRRSEDWDAPPLGGEEGTILLTTFILK